MQDLKQTSLSDLVDLLSVQTASYTGMIRSGATQEEFDKCGEEIKKIQLEIAIRKAITDQNTDTTSSGISFDKDATDSTSATSTDNLN